MNGLVFLGTLLSLLIGVWSYPSGAPLSRCGSMLPGHGYDPLPGEKPYQIQVKPISKRSYEVTIYSESDRFKGFLIEARTDADEEEAIGVWSTEVPHTKTIDCFDSDDSAVTHHYDDDSSNEDEDHNSFRFRDRRSNEEEYSEFEGYDPHKKSFSNVTFTWQAPSRWLHDDNKIVFIATVVEKYNRIYTDIIKTVDLPKSLKHFKHHHHHHRHRHDELDES